MSDFTQQNIDEVAAAVRQVVSVNPQLLYKAMQKVYVDLTLDVLKEDCQPTPNRKKREAFVFRCALCLQIARMLLQAGKAHMDMDDIAAMQNYMTFIGGGN